MLLTQTLLHCPHISAVCDHWTNHDKLLFVRKSLKKKVCFYIAQFPVLWTAQSALHFTPQTCSFRHQLGFSGKHSSHASITRKDYSLIINSSTVYSQGLIYTAERTGGSWKEQKCPNFETVAKWIFIFQLGLLIFPYCPTFSTIMFYRFCFQYFRDFLSQWPDITPHMFHSDLILFVTPFFSLWGLMQYILILYFNLCWLAFLAVPIDCVDSNRTLYIYHTYHSDDIVMANFLEFPGKLHMLFYCDVLYWTRRVPVRGNHQCVWFVWNIG